MARGIEVDPRANESVQTPLSRRPLLSHDEDGFRSNNNPARLAFIL